MNARLFVLNPTDRKRVKEAKRQPDADFAHMNRVSVMGELAASLAHEIAQPIASARNDVRAAQSFLETLPPNLGEVTEALACVVGDVARSGTSSTVSVSTSRNRRREGSVLS
jgi:C4-dicarboxylate-specific signal transduction histidine kinase